MPLIKEFYVTIYPNIRHTLFCYSSQVLRRMFYVTIFTSASCNMIKNQLKIVKLSLLSRLVNTKAAPTKNKCFSDVLEKNPEVNRRA